MIKKFFEKIYRTDEDITKEELINMLESNSDIILLDVRSEQEFKEGHLRNAINIPLYELYSNVERILQDKTLVVIVYCQVGIRSKKATRILKKIGYKNVYNLKGGIE